MNIHYFKTYATDKNLGRAYNYDMSLLKNDDDWACFVDGDSMFLMPNYGDQIKHIVEKYPDAGMFTCLTNRVGQLDQCYEGKMSDNADILFHEEIAIKLQKERYSDIKEYKGVISGTLMLIQKKTWDEVGGVSPKGILGIDNEISSKVLKAEKKIYIMEGVYIFHKYRLRTGVHDKSHLL